MRSATPQNLAGLRQLISGVKPWVGVAVILSVVLLGYFLVQGWRYWQASGDISSLDREILYLENSMRLMILAGIAAAVELTAINPSPPEIKVLGELQYHVRPIAISVGGSTANIFWFLTLLYENIPVVLVSDLTISALGASPLVQMQIRFYLSPSPIEAAEESS